MKPDKDSPFMDIRDSACVFPLYFTFAQIGFTCVANCDGDDSGLYKPGQRTFGEKSGSFPEPKQPGTRDNSFPGRAGSFRQGDCVKRSVGA